MNDYIWLLIPMLIGIFSLIIMCTNRICDKIYKVELSLIPIDVQVMGYLKCIDSKINEVWKEVNAINMMLQFQEAREQQQDKPEEKSGELSSKV